MPIIIPANSAVSGGYDVSNSLRFNDGSSDYLSQTISSSAGKIFTLSFWMKKSTNGSINHLFNLSSDSNTHKYIDIATKSGVGLDVQFKDANGGTYLRRQVTSLFRDFSAWMHICIRFNSTESSASNRLRIYINGTQATNINEDGTGDIPLNYVTDLNTNGSTLNIGRNITEGQYYDGYLAEYVLIDSSSLAPDQFGEFDEDSGIWKPIKVSGLTFGTNGFYLDFEDSSALGNDAAGSNNFTVNNLTAIDQSLDSCTTNFATLNPLDVYASKTGVLSEGNLKLTATASQLHTAVGTIAPSNGKWYLEVELDAISGSNNSNVGISDLARDDKSNMPSKKTWGYGYNPDGTKQNNGSDSSYGNSYTAGDILGVAMDLDNGAVYFSKNGTFQASGDPTSGASKTNAAFTWTPDASMNWVPYVADNTSGVAFTWITNFGSPPTAISSGNADGDGYGNFEYAVPSGYFSLNTKNLAEYG